MAGEAQLMQGSRHFFTPQNQRQELNRIHDRLNQTFFAGKLRPIPCFFEVKELPLLSGIPRDAMGVLRFNPNTREATCILLSREVLDFAWPRNLFTINRVVLHEMVHQSNIQEHEVSPADHGPLFLEECHRIESLVGQKRSAAEDAGAWPHFGVSCTGDAQLFMDDLDNKYMAVKPVSVPKRPPMTEQEIAMQSADLAKHFKPRFPRSRWR